MDQQKTITPEQIAKALQHDSEAAALMDSGRELLIAAARKLDRPERRSAHLDVIGALARLDNARSQVVGSDE